MIGCLPWPICLHDILNREKFIRGGTVHKTSRKLPIVDHVYTLAGLVVLAQSESKGTSHWARKEARKVEQWVLQAETGPEDYW